LAKVCHKLIFLFESLVLTLIHDTIAEHLSHCITYTVHILYRATILNKSAQNCMFWTKIGKFDRIK